MDIVDGTHVVGFQLDELRRDRNKVQKEIGLKRKVRRALLRRESDMLTIC